MAIENCHFSVRFYEVCRSFCGKLCIVQICCRISHIPLCTDFNFQWCPLYLMLFKNGVIANIKAFPASDDVIKLFYDFYEVSVFY